MIVAQLRGVKFYQKGGYWDVEGDAWNSNHARSSRAFNDVGHACGFASPRMDYLTALNKEGKALLTRKLSEKSC